MRLGILGGTFDPIHLGHLILASCAHSQLKLDRVLFIPAGQPWRKAGREVADGESRLEMVRLAIAGDTRFEADDRELRRKGPTYTVDSLRELKAQRVGAELLLIAGEDALADLPHWHDPQGILSLARLAVAPRLKTPVPPAPASHRQAPIPLPDYDPIDMPYIGISSTDLRGRVRRGESLRYLVPAAVEAYIRKRRLYVKPTDPDQDLLPTPGVNSASSNP